MSERLKEYIIDLIEQIGDPITHPRYPEPVLLQCKIDTITKLPLFYFEKYSEKQNEPKEAEVPKKVNDANESMENEKREYYYESVNKEEPSDRESDKEEPGDNETDKEEPSDSREEPSDSKEEQHGGKRKPKFVLEESDSDSSKTPQPKYFCEYNDAWLYTASNGNIVKIVNKKYLSKNRKDLDATVERMLVNTFGDDYETNSKHIAMQEKYKKVTKAKK
jgi:hypothetical protein